MDKSQILENISRLLLENRIEEAKATIQNDYPHKHIDLEKRSYTLKEKMEQFLRDGFILSLLAENNKKQKTGLAISSLVFSMFIEFCKNTKYF